MSRITFYAVVFIVRFHVRNIAYDNTCFCRPPDFLGNVDFLPIRCAYRSLARAFLLPADFPFIAFFAPCTPGA